MSSSKYKLYEKRMVSFLKQPAIEGILKGKASHLVVAEQSIMKATEDVKNVQKHADRLLKKSEMCEYRKQSTIAKELNKQESILEARIGRRRSMSNRSTTEDRGDDFEDMPKPKKIITLNSFENSYDLEMSELIRSKIGRMAEEKKQVRKVVHL